MRIPSRTFLLAGLLCAGLGCGSSTAPENLPWMKDLIQRLESEPAGLRPAEIIEYEYRGMPVYFVPVHQCCDMTSELYDQRGTLICLPDGGITGKGDGRCPDFLTARSHERLIWRDPRA
jgi:hypothetical protein